MVDFSDLFQSHILSSTTYDLVKSTVTTKLQEQEHKAILGINRLIQEMNAMHKYKTKNQFKLHAESHLESKVETRQNDEKQQRMSSLINI